MRLRRRLAGILAVALGMQGFVGCAGLRAPGETSSGAIRSEGSQLPAEGSPFYGDVRQLTFAGRRSGEGYFSRNGREIVFQSEREPGNPFYQIYRMDLTTGETQRISTGRGRASCGWIVPSGDAVLFASTHLDPEAEAKQARELEDRAQGQSRRYAWDFDDRYDLFLARDDGSLERWTEAAGYDAEGAFSPDGRLIVFASNRHAYDRDRDEGQALSSEDRARLAEDPSFFIDLYLLDTETRAVRRLTTTPGYDGGPFFSPDGERVVYRHFSEDGARAEIHSIRVDGTDERVLTRIGAMSWAPFYHPSGDYVVFTTNLHGFDNFELYLVDSLGLRQPVRVTQSEGFDGLPVFSPSGDTLLWTRNRTTDGGSQLFRASWDDAAARAALGLEPAADATATAIEPAQMRPAPLAHSESPDITAADLAPVIAALTAPEMEGRRAGTAGEQRAADFLERAMEAIGLEPAGDDGEFRSAFDFTAGVSLGPANHLDLFFQAPAATRSGPHTAPRPGAEESTAPGFEIDRDWRPLAFSRTGEIAPSAVVFAGYGLVAPALNGFAAVDAYAERDVQDRWVMIFRDLPQSLEGEVRQHLQRYASLRHKAMIARDHGARGVLFVSGPLGRFRDELVPLRFDASLAGTRIAVLSLSNEAAERFLRPTGRSLEEVQRACDVALDGAGFEIPEARLGAEIDLVLERSQGTNVIGRLRAGARPSDQVIVLGAHYDHLGRGEGTSSLATADEIGEIHSGADDNASGVAVVLGIAEALVRRRERGDSIGHRDFVFAAWSGEEVGLLGSDRWAGDTLTPHASEGQPIAYLNFDMVGRLRESLVVQGLGSSPDWAAILESAAVPVDLAIWPQNDSYLPTDATSFYTRGIPILSAFTGVHSEYHTPRDQPQLLNLDGAARIATLFERIALALAHQPEPPAYQAQRAPTGGAARSGFRVFLGTVPDYAQSDVEGVKLSGVAPQGPAEKAGVRGGDVIVEVDGRPIENLYDYTYALESLRVGEPASFVVERDGARIRLEIVPASRD